MPITVDQKQQALSLANLDPSKWDVNDEGTMFVAKQQPHVLPQPVSYVPQDDSSLNPPMQTKQSDSPLVTAAKTTLDAAPSSLTGGLGAASTAAFLGGLGLDMTGVGALVGIPLSLLGGAGAAYATRKAQNAVLPQVDSSYQPYLSQSQATNPNAAAIGDLASIPLGGFNPGLGGVRAIGGLAKLATGMRPTASEISDILNTGVGATTSAIGTAVQGDLNPSDIAKSALTGAVFSSPNSIGKRMGFQSHEQPNPINNPQALQQSLIDGTPTASQAKETQPSTTTSDDMLNPKVSPDVNTTAGLNPDGTEFQTAQQTALAKYKATPDDGQEKMMEGEGGIIPPVEQPEIQPATKVVVQQPIPEVQPSTTTAEPVVVPEVETSPAVAPVPETPPVVQQPETVPPVVDDTLAKAKAATDALNNKQYQASTSLGTDIAQKLQDKGIPSKPTKEWYNMLKTFGVDMKGVTTDSDGDLVHETTKQPVNGVASIQDGLRQIIVNPNRAAIDTQPHELFHVFLHDMENSPSQTDKALTKRLVDLTKQSPEFIQRHPEGATKANVDEFITSQQGLEFLKQQLNLNDESGFKKWFNDFKSNINVKFGKDSSLEDVRRLMNYKFVNDKVHVLNVRTGAVNNQSNSELSDDAKKYEESQKIMKEEDFGSDKFMQAWKDSEDIKNKHDGKTPEHGQYQDDSELNPKTGKPYSRSRAYERAAQREAFGEIPDRTNKAFTDKHHTPVDERTLVDISKSDVVDSDGKVKNDVVDTIGKVGNSKLNWLYAQFQKNTGKAFDVIQNRTGKDYLNVPENLRRSELLAQVQQDIIQHGLDSDGLIPTIRRRVRTVFDNAIKSYKPEVSLNQKSKISGNELGDFISAPQQGSIEHEAPVVDKTEVKAPVKIKQENISANKAEMTVGEMLTALEESGINNEELFEHLEERVKNGEVDEPVDPKALVKRFSVNIKDTRQYQEESPINKTSKQTEKVSSSLLYKFLKVKPALEVLRESSGDKGQELAKGFEKYFIDRNGLYGKYFNPVVNSAKGMEESGIRKVEKVLLEENKTGVLMRDQLFGKQLKLYDTIRASLLQKQNDQIAAGQRVTAFDANNRPFQRDAQVNPTYYPNKVSPKVIEEITENGPHRAKLLQDFIDHQVNSDDSARPTEKKEELAKEKLDNLLMGFEGQSSNQTKFNANRISEGVGLPDSWMRPGLLKNLSSYYSKVANDRSFYDSIESKPELNNLIDPRNPQGIYHAAKDVLEQVKGEPFDKDASALKAWNRIATSAMLGPLTNVHISLSTFANSLQYLKPLEAPQAYTHALTSMKGWYQKALETGYARKDLTSIKDLQDANNTHIEKLKEVANLIGKVGGRQLSDIMTKAFSQGMGDFIVRVRRVEANNGDKQAIEMMKQVDPQWEKNKQYTKQQFDQMASTFAGFMHGAHDARTLPTFMLKEGIVQPFLSLMSWSVAQTNQWMKHVWTPATKGNYAPLLMSTFGAAVGGYIIQQLRQKIADKKSAIPSLQEIAASHGGLAGNPSLLAYNFMQMASYTGWAGIASTLGKDAFDLAYKNIPQGSTFPLDEAIEGSLETGGEAFSAMMQAHSTDDVLQIAAKASQDLVKENVQTARLASTWAADSGLLGDAQQQAKKVNEASGDERRYEIANQLPYEQQLANNNNPYLHLDEKAFRRTGDISQAAGMIPQLINDELTESNGNLDVAKDKIKGLKENSYQTIPDPQREPIQFARYYNYMVQTLGPQAASERLVDYMQHNAVNKLKSKLIPSI